ncbi:alanine racemase [Streptomyces sp. TP-A0874]|uniref:alanine racemase n=1 Tax=Streptomyces sp. TP-A0874 TaxID=549819 RepID=UPI00085315A0|nr:alanine racemase [Streptomyces sp. TP-A0874]
MRPEIDQASGSARREDLAWREIRLEAVRENIASLRSMCEAARFMMVVKADAYSHGAVTVARAALDAGAEHLGVAILQEAFDLRRAGIRAPILAWMAGPGAAYEDAIRADIELAAYARVQLNEIAEAARRSRTPARLHLKADTGMWRGGAAGEWGSLVTAARALELEGVVDVVGVWSHLACADVPEDPANNAQREAFLLAVAEAEAAGLRPRWRHLANSAATLTRPDVHFDMVRCGLAVYGVNPLVSQRPAVALRPAMSVRARVTHVKDAPADVGVSYGHTYRTTSATRLALVPMGYADGLPVPASGTARVGHRGHPLPIAGRVCMDQFVVDIGDSAVRPGEIVTVLGDGSDGEATAEEWARANGRSSYEMLTGFGRTRVPARYPAALTVHAQTPRRRE